MSYLYYTLWQLFKRIKTNDMPATNAMIFISICHFLNLSLIFIFLTYYSLEKIYFSSKSEIYYFTIPIGLIIYLLNYYTLYKKRDEFYEKHKNETNKQKTIGKIILALYVIGSVVSALYFGSKYSL